MANPYDAFMPHGAAPAPAPAPVIPGASNPPPAPQITAPAPAPTAAPVPSPAMPLAPTPEAGPAMPAPAAPAEPAAPAPEADANPYDQFMPKGARPAPSAAGAAFRSFLPTVAPTLGGFAAGASGAELGALAGAAIGGPFAPVTGALGGVAGFAGAVGGFTLGGAAISAAQGYAMSLMPQGIQRMTGFDPQQQADDAKAHPWGQDAGQLASTILTMSPTGVAKDAIEKLGPNATSFAKLMANPITHRLISGTMMASLNLAQEKVDGQKLDWQNAALSFATGTMFARPYKYADALAHWGGSLTQKLIRWGQGMPTVAQAGGMGVMGPGITPEVAAGTEEQTPISKEINERAASAEADLTQPSTPADIHQVVRQMHPELFQRYDALTQQANDLRSWIDSEKNPDPDDIAAAKDKLDYANGQLESARNPPMGTPRSRDVPRLNAIATDAQNQYNDLAGRAAAWASGTAGDTAGTALARQHLADVNNELAGMAEDVGNAYRRAAETPEGLTSQPTSPEATPSGEMPPGATERPPGATGAAPAAPPGRPIEEQRQAIASDVARRLIASGQDAATAKANGDLAAAYYVTRYQRLPSLGSPEDIYLRYAPGIAGPGGGPLMPTLERPEIGARRPEPPTSPEAPPSGEPPPGPGPAPAPRPVGPAGQAEMPLQSPAEPRPAPHPAPAPAEATAAEPSPAAQADRKASPASDIESLDPTAIGVDAGRFQFKEGGNEEGITDRLDGVQEWDPRLAGTVLVFRDAHGKDWVADGHQRLGLAKRLAETQPGIRLNAFVLKAEDGITDARARVIAAAKNIAEGTGTSVDAAKVLREAKAEDMPPLPPRSTLVREGKALARLSPDAFGMVVNEVVPTNQAAIVGRLVSDPLVQEEAMRVLARVQPDNIRQAELVIRQIMESGTNLETSQGSLFGDEVFASSTVLERAKIADVASQQLRRDKAVFAVLTNEADRITSHGDNILDVESNRKRLTDDERASDLITALATRHGPVSDTLTAIAQRYKAGEISAANAAKEFLDAVKEHLQGRLAEGDNAGSVEPGAIGEREGAEVTTPEGQFDLLDGGTLPASQHEAFADRAAADVWNDLSGARSGEATEDMFATSGDMFTTSGGEDLLAVNEPAGDIQVIAAEPDEDGQTEISLHNPEDGSIEPIGTTDFKQTAAMVRDEQPAPVGAPLPDDADESDAEVLRRSAAPETNPDIVAERDIAATSAPVVVPEPERADAAAQPNRYADKWYGSRAKAEDFIAKQGIGETHEVTQDGKRFLIGVRRAAAGNQEPLTAGTTVEERPAAESPIAGEQPAAQEPETVVDRKGHTWTLLGKNHRGEDLWRDERGIHSITSDGIRYSEPVTIRPDGGFETNRDLHPEFKLAEPAAEPTRENAQVEESAKSTGPTKEAFIAAYADALRAKFEWARDPARLSSFLSSARHTIFNNGGGWAWEQDTSKAAWKAIGGKGKMTLKGLREMPEGDRAAEAATPEPQGQNENNIVPIAEPEQPGVEPEQQQEAPTDGGNGPELQQHGGALPAGAPSLPEGEQPAIPGGTDEIRPLGGASEGDSGGRSGNARSNRANGDGAGRGGKGVSSRASSQATKPPVDGPGVRAPRPDTPAATGTDEARVAKQKGTRSNYRITDDDHIGEGNQREKINQNLEAIRTLKQIEEETREATPEEKAKLVKYTGWGAHAQDMFKMDRDNRFKKEREELRNLLTEDEYKAATLSTLNAHYTSPDVIRGMWDSLIHLGYDGGLAIEPSMGVGHFIGLIPDGLAPHTAWTGVELDHITGRIAKHLYGGSEVNVRGFETLRRPSNYYDLAVSNVPFGNYPVTEKPYGTHNIHNFFFIKALDKVRPGGIVAFVTSRYTMDSRDPAIRDRLSKDADFIGAIRLPGGSKGAFAGNAGTDVTTDIIYLRKRAPGDAPYEGAHEWSGLKEIEAPDDSSPDAPKGKASINQYFADNPHMMLGEMRLTRGQYRSGEPTLVGNAEGLRERVAEAAGHMAPAAFGQRTTAAPEIKASDAPDAVKEGGFFLKDGKVHRLEDGLPVHKDKLDAPTVDKVSRLVRMRDIYNDLLNTQVNGGENAAAQSEHLRERLRAEYDAFVAKHGPINREVRTAGKPKPTGEPTFRISRPNFRAFQDDPDAYKVAAIENYDAETDTAARADAQTKDIITKPEARQINSPPDALAAVLDTHGRVDMQEIGRLMGVDNEAEVARQLDDRVFNNPDGRQWQTAEDYLSGDVVSKLENAHAIAEMNPAYQRNVEALEKVQPTPLLPHEITPLMGSGWIPTDVYEAFAHEQGAEQMKVKRVPITGEFSNQARSWSQSASAKWGTDRVPVHQIFDAALNDKVLTVHDKGVDDKPVVNFEQTEMARAKVQEMKTLFAGDKQVGADPWVWEDQDRSDRLAAIYNRTHNNIAKRRFDGSHQTFPGLNAKFKLRKWQYDAVWRIIQTGNTLLGHEVGAGKTLEMICAAMEQRRLGLVKKPMIGVPNHMLEQFTREFYDAYPNAKILVATKEDVNAKRRKAFVGKAAANDWDAIITTHNNFGRIPMSQESQLAHMQAQVDEIEEVKRQAQVEAGGKDDITVKELEKLRQKAIARITKLMNSPRKDAGATFEEMGVDHVMIDEAHLFKNLAFPTKKTRIKGLANTASQRAEDLFMKLQYLDQKRPGRSGVFATGTPISNTIAEMWTMMRYLMLPTLREHGMQSFDAWANTFTRSETRTEIATDGRTMVPETSLRFANLPELMNLYGHVADTQTAAMLNLPRPDLTTADGKPGIQVVQAEPTPQEEAKIEALIREREEIKGKKPEKGQRNALNIVTDGRKVATDGRLIDPSAFPFNPQGKIAKAVENIAKIYHEGQAPALGQMVFLDMGVPNDANKGWGSTKAGQAHIDAGESEDEEDADFDDGGVPDPIANEESKINLYEDLKQRLIAAGVKPEHIAFIHDAPKDAQKARLFKDVREGNVRVLIGSTNKMGVGTNVQRQLIAMHHLDAPWKPAEIQQRDGRILRQGNLNPKVQIYRYITKRTFDTFMWNKLDTKSGFIGQMLAGARGVREMEDVDSPLPEAADMKAAASGDPRIMEHAELGRQVRALIGQKRAFDGTQHRSDFALRAAKSNLENLERNLPAARADAAKATDISGDKFRVTIGGKEHTKRAEAGAEVIRAAMAAPRDYSGQDIHIGHMSGLEMRAEIKDGYDQTGNFRTFWPYLKGEQKTGAPQSYMISAESDPGGVMRRYENALDKLSKRPADIEARTAENRAEIGKLSSTLQAKWPRAQELADVSRKFADLEAALKAPAQRGADIGAEDESDAATGDLPGGGAMELNQGAGRRQGRNGFIAVQRGVRSIIHMLATADASTFIHESAHQWLEDLHSDSQHTAASMQLRQDMATVHKYLGSKQGKPFSRTQHEKFARTFERYMREGRAPSARLAQVFEKFKGWLMTIYRAVRDIPGRHPINDDIRQVFDRMLELEPENQHPIIAGEEPHAPGLAEVHESDAAEVEPASADAGADRVEAEAQAYEATQKPETANEIASASQAHDAAAGPGAGPGGGTAEPGGQAGGEPGQRGQVEGDRGAAGPIPGRGGGGEQPGAIVSGGNADAANGAGTPAGTDRGAGPGAKSANGNEPGAEPGAATGANTGAEGAGNGNGTGSGSVPKSPVEQFTPGPTQQYDTAPELPDVDKAGNVRLDNMQEGEQFKQALRDSAARKGDFITQRRGVIPDHLMLQLAQALGMDPEKLNRRRIGQAFSADEITAAFPVVQQATDAVMAASKLAHTPEGALAYAEAEARLDMIMGQFAGATAEAGRALRSLGMIRKQFGRELNQAMELNQLIKNATGKTPEEIQARAKLVSMLDTPEKVAKQIADTREKSRGQKLFEFYQNNLLSGPLTHITYAIGMGLTSTFHGLVDLPATVAVGAFRTHMLGQEGAGAKMGEVGAQLGAIQHGAVPALHAAARAFRTGTTGLLPGEDETENPFMGDRQAFTPPEQLNQNATLHDIKGEFNAFKQGLKDGINTVGAITNSQGVYAGFKAGFGAAKPVYFAPQRFIAAIHTLFRSANYSRVISAEAYRQAVSEGHAGMDLAARMAEIRLNPSPEAMTRAHNEANGATLMDQGGNFTRRLTSLLSSEVNLPLLGDTPVFRFAMPFVRIMSNMLSHAYIERTPLGFLSPQLRADMASKDRVTSDAAIARVLTGTALAALSGFMAYEGYVTGSGPSDPKARALWLQAGYQPDSIRIGNTWVQLSRLGSLGMLVGAAADVANGAMKLGNGDWQGATGSLINGFVHNLVDESFMQGVSQMLSAAENPVQYGGAFLRNIATGFLPESVLMNQIAHAMDPYTREARTMAGSIQNRIPMYSEGLTPRRNMFGEPIPSPDAIAGTAIDMSAMKNDPILNQMIQLGTAPAPLRPYVLNVKLNPQQYDDLQRIYGRVLKMNLTSMMNTPEWSQATDDQKRFAIDYKVKTARAYAENQIAHMYPQIPAEETARRIARARGGPENNNANMDD